MAIDNNLLSIDSDDDNKDYEAFNQYLEEDTKRKMIKTVSEIEQMGDKYLKEIERKKKNKELLKNKLIPYILKHSIYEEDELNSYSFEDVQKIYNEIKAQNRPAIVKFFHFIFNID